MLLLPLLLGCRAPPQAPETLDALMGYLYAHGDDEDPEAAVVAAENLGTWLDDHLEATLAGYQVDDLDPEVMAALTDEVPDPERLVGAAVGHASAWDAVTLGSTNAVSPGADLSDWGTEGAGRVYRSDPACFAARTCDTLVSEEWATDELPLGIVAETHWWQEWRWLELPAGPAMLQRWWIVEPIDFNVSFLAVDQQYYAWIFLPAAEGSVSVQAVWIAATLTGAPVPETVALDLVVSNMSGTAENLDGRVEE